MASETSLNDEKIAQKVEEEEYLMRAELLRPTSEELVTKFQGIQVQFCLTIINALYGLLNVDTNGFRGKYKRLCNKWLVAKLYGGEPLELFPLNILIDSHNFTIKIKSWLSIVCVRIILSTHDTIVISARVVLIVAIMDGMEIYA
ncbi:hypothetical protein KY290_031158 [Solanum tuberosum]|uniref:Uncharacterized protein n=1 Tax=Solanum tuberosum TaxID=4113 RepID=A0ABQ7UBU0_SOLTU|nr:hypothetical protein KY290_031158 [Solanum tuberosum]